MWKVYHIQSGRIVKAGFDSDDQAKEWLERRKDLPDDEHDIDEMDEEEEEEYLEREGEEDEEDDTFEPELTDVDADRELTYPEGDVGAADLDDDEETAVDDEDEDEDEDEEEASHDDEDDDEF